MLEHNSTQANHQGGARDKVDKVFDAAGGKAVIDAAFALGQRSCSVKLSFLNAASSGSKTQTRF